MRHILLFVAITTGIAGFTQKPKITWGEEFKLRRGSTDLEVIYADKNAVYLEEGHLALKSYFLIGATMRESGTLVKLDKNLTEVYRNNFNKDLRGKEFVQFFALQDKMFLFATEYLRSDRTLNVYGAEIDKNSGELAGSFKPMASFQKEEKRDEINFKITLNADSSKLVIVSTIEGKSKNEYTIQEFDKTLKPLSKPITLANEFDPKTFQLEDVLYTINKKIVLVGRIYEYQEGKKKKDRFLDFANYNVRIYDEKGNQQKEINTNINGKWLTSTRLVQERDQDIVLAAFYNNTRKGKTIDGMLVQRINPETGEVISTSEQPINHSLLSDDSDDSVDEADESETKQERKEREKRDKMKNEGEAFSKYMQFRNIIYTKDNGLVILAEKYHHYTYTVPHYRPGINGIGGSWSTETYSVYECGDIMMCKIDASGNIGWLQVLPKAQREVIRVDRYSGFSFIGFFDPSNRPFYAGFGAVQNDNTLHILFNDNPKNAVVTQAGQKVKRTSRFGKSDCFLLTVDMATGKLNRKMFFTNADVPTSMPRLGSVIGDGMYIVGKDDRVLGKTKIAVAKITMD